MPNPRTAPCRSSAQAQVSAGLLGLGACVSACAGASGGYVEGSFRSGWAGGFASLNAFRNHYVGSGGHAQVGASFYPGSGAWFVRPVIRGSAILAANRFFALGGGVEAGRRAGVQVLVDWGRIDSLITVALVKVGGYWSF